MPCLSLSVYMLICGESCLLSVLCFPLIHTHPSIGLSTTVLLVGLLLMRGHAMHPWLIFEQTLFESLLNCAGPPAVYTRGKHDGKDALFAVQAAPASNGVRSRELPVWW